MEVHQTRSALLEALKERCIAATADMELPTQLKQNDAMEIKRAPDIYKMRLSDSSHFKKLAPYVILQFVNGIDVQKTGHWDDSSAVIRMIICVYCEREDEGAMMLLNVMDRLRLDLLREPVVGGAFKLDTDQGLEALVYVDDTAPFYGGEMMATFYCPPVKRDVRF